MCPLEHWHFGWTSGCPSLVKGSFWGLEFCINTPNLPAMSLFLNGSLYLAFVIPTNLLMGLNEQDVWKKTNKFWRPKSGFIVGFLKLLLAKSLPLEMKLNLKSFIYLESTCTFPRCFQMLIRIGNWTFHICSHDLLEDTSGKFHPQNSSPSQLG
jgi:hypothetical protein